jgi:hypothetical protein
MGDVWNWLRIMSSALAVLNLRDIVTSPLVNGPKGRLYIYVCLCVLKGRGSYICMRCDSSSINFIAVLTETPCFKMCTHFTFSLYQVQAVKFTHAQPDVSLNGKFAGVALLCGEESLLLDLGPSDGGGGGWGRGVFHCSVRTNPQRLNRGSGRDCGSCLSSPGPQNKQPTLDCPAQWCRTLPLLYTATAHIGTSRLPMWADDIF